MNFSSYPINEREYSLVLSLENELNFAPNKNYLFDLSYLSLLALEGKDDFVRTFLQGQLSCDIREVNQNTIRQGAMCNLKGRILALLDVIDWQGLKLVLPNDLMNSTEQSLSKAAMLSRVRLAPTDSLQIFGFFLANQEDLLPANLTLADKSLELNASSHACCYSLSKQLYIIVIAKEFASTLAEPFQFKQQMRGSLSWHQLQLMRKSVEIYPSTRGLFLPHRIDLHRFGYLSFDKGCYKGQEIIARTHFRAKLKHGLQLFTLESTERLTAGAKIFTANQQTEVGELIDYCPLEKNHYLIAASMLFDAPKEVFFEKQSKAVLLLPC